MAIDGTTSQPFTHRAGAASQVVDHDGARRTKLAALARYGRRSELFERELLSTIRWMGKRRGPIGWYA